MEEFKDIKGYKGLYKVSNYGNIISLKYGKKKVLKPYDLKGYCRIGLSNSYGRKHFLIHRLVAEAFLGYDKNTYNSVIDHINNNKKDNAVTNLQIITQRLNASKDRNNGSSSYIGVTWDKSRAKWKSSMYHNGKHIFLGRFNCELAASYAYNKALAEII